MKAEVGDKGQVPLSPNVKNITDVVLKLSIQKVQGGERLHRGDKKDDVNAMGIRPHRGYTWVEGVCCKENEGERSLNSFII